MDDDEGLLQATERRLARFSARIGWRPDVTLDSLVEVAGVELVSIDVVPPFRLFRPIRFRNLPAAAPAESYRIAPHRSEEHTSDLQSLMRISYAVFCFDKNTHTQT